ncbi:MAG: hypothetical protein ABJF23_24875 [Bryobacteraceae bacterium]
MHILYGNTEEQHKKKLAAALLDRYTFADLAGHRDFATAYHYRHPQADAIRAAIEKGKEWA